MGLEVEVVADTNKFDVIVIGGGIAGMTAAANVKQQGLTSCFLDKDAPGGKLLRIKEIHNVQQFNGMSGPNVAQQYMAYVTDQVKANYSWGEVKSIKTKNDYFYIFTTDGQTWEAKSIIVATGTVVNKLNVPGEEKYFNHGLSYCIACDAVLTKGLDVAVIGSDAHINKLQDIAKTITVVRSSDVERIEGDDKQPHRVVTKNGGVVQCQYIFVENGFVSDLSFLPKDVAINGKNEIIVDQYMGNTYPGIFACGDCTNTSNKIINNAINQATTAASSAVKYVKSKNW